jgi:OOP family OmpA-OmpF porin
MEMIRLITTCFRRNVIVAAFLPALALAGCVAMTPVTGGVMSTSYEQRFTDEAIMRDWGAMDALRGRIAAARLRDPSNYAVTRAEAELNFAIDEYEENDRTGVLEPLLNDARRMVDSREPGYSGPVDLSLPMLPGVKETRQDLRDLTKQAKADKATLECAGESIARLETGLLMLAHEQYEVSVGLNTPEHIGPRELLVDQLAAALREAMKAPACTPSLAPVQENKPAAMPAVISSLTLAASVLFPFDTCGEVDMLPEGRAQLDNFGTLLVQNPDIWRRLVVSGHTDRLGRNEYNIKLSMCRAETVRLYLVKNFRVPPERIEARGMAFLEPLVFCTGPRNDRLKACLQPNRRVELEVKK